MTTRMEAEALVRQYLDRMQQGRDYRLVIMQSFTREEEFGWIYFYNSEQFIETGNMSHALAGNAPIIVDRESGELHVTGTAHGIEWYVEKYRADRKTRR